jgi:hypothetical protein
VTNAAPHRAQAELHRLTAFVRLVRWGITGIVFVLLADFLAGEDLKVFVQATQYGDDNRLPGTILSLILAGAISLVVAWVIGVAAGYTYRHREARARTQAARERATIVALASSSRMNNAKNAASSANPTATANATCTPVSAPSRPAASSPGDSAP